MKKYGYNVKIRWLKKIICKIVGHKPEGNRCLRCGL